MSRHSNLAYKYDPEPEPERSRVEATTKATPLAAAADALALPDGHAAKGIMLAAVLGIGAWSVAGAGVLSLWRLMA